MTTIVEPRSRYGDCGGTVTGDEVIALADLMALPEYSCTIPTGTTIGKRWRRATIWGRRADKPLEKYPDTEWWIGTYVEDPEPHMVGIVWEWAVAELETPHRTPR